MTNDDLFVELYTGLFRPRQDVVARKWEYVDRTSQKTDKKYRPICSNEKTEQCPKSTNRSVNCKDCSQAKYQGLDSELLKQHLDGKISLGMYPLLSDNTCNFIAVDWDDHKGDRSPIDDVRSFYRECQVHELPCYVLRSQSGRGFHTYTFFTEAVPAWKPRAVMTALLTQTGLIGEASGEDKAKSSFDRFFPNQDELSGKGIGNLIAMPFQGKCIKSGNTTLLDPATGFENPYDDQISALKNVEKISESRLDEMLERFNLSQEPGPTANKSSHQSPTRQDQLDAICQCEFFKWAYENQDQVREPLWWAMVSNVIAIKPGGADLVHLMSSQHQSYSQQETTQKIIDGINGPGPHTCEYIKKDLGFDCKKDCGVKSPIVLVNRSLKSAGGSVNQFPESLVIDLVPNAPVSPSAVMPPGYALSNDQGVVFTGGSKKSGTFTVASSPIIITARLKSIDSGSEVLLLSYFRDGQWQTRKVERQTVAAARTIVELAEFGVPVTSITAKDLVQYLAEYEHCNENKMPKASVTNILGWQDKNQGFLLGNRFFGIDENDAGVIDGTYETSCPGSWPGKVIMFHPSYDGDQQTASGFREKGSFEKWASLIMRLYPYPRALLAVYMSLATPFLEILDAPNLVVNWSCKSSVGKTTILRVAASCYGNPDEKSNNSVMSTWNTTKVAIERKAGLLSHLPLIIDETKLAATGNNDRLGAGLVKTVVYMVANGKGKSRGSIKGFQTEASWRTILLSTGEFEIGDIANEGGVAARVIEISGPPFVGVTQDTAELVMEIDRVVKANYGLAGPKVIRFLLENREHWGEFREQYSKKQGEILTSVQGDGIAFRLTNVAAFLSVVIPLIHAAVPELGQQPPTELVIQTLWDCIDVSLKEGNKVLEALRLAYNYASVNQDKFYYKDSPEKEPNGGWYGVWDGDLPCFESKKLIEFLNGSGFDGKAMIRNWRDEGYLIAGRNTIVKQKRIKCKQVDCYCLGQEALDAIEVGPDQSDAVFDISNRSPGNVIQFDQHAGHANPFAKAP